MPETISDHPPMAPRPAAPRQRHRYTKILDAGGGFARKGLESVDLAEVAARAALSEKAVAAAAGDATAARVLLLTITGLVQSVRSRRLSLFEAEEDLKKACARLSRAANTATHLPKARNWSRPILH